MNIKIIAGAIVEKDGMILIVQENKPEAKGLWNLPAGRMEAGEWIKDTALREIEEETGFKVALEGLIGVYERASDDHDEAIAFYFKAIPIAGELKFPEDEIMNVRWVTYDEFLAMDNELFRNDRIKKIVEDYQVRGAMELDMIHSIK